MNEINKTSGHPKGLYFLFFTEMWERFSYYGMRAIFILFMTKILLMKDADASQIYGSYTGLVYLTPLLGGYLCDKFLGNRRSIIIGGLLMALGQFLMFLSASSGAGATGMHTQIAVGNHLQLGNWNCIDFELVIFDLSHVNKALIEHKSKPVHGIIGADILLKGRGIIDYYNHCLYLRK